MITKKEFTLGLLSILIFLAAFNLIIVETSLKDWFGTINGSIFEPVLMWVFYTLVSALILFFSNEAIFRKWFKLFLVYVCFSIVIIISSSTSTSFFGPDRVDMSIVIGQAMSIFTLIFALVHKFYFKTQ